MSATPEQSAANDVLVKAIQDVIDAYDLPCKRDDGAVIVDFMVIVEHACIGADGEDRENYNLLFHHGDTRRSTALGLLAEARDMLGYNRGSTD
jgi:hypothetical protein